MRDEETLTVNSLTTGLHKGVTNSSVVFSSGIAGGLTNLSKMPACNLMLLGAQRRTLSGFSSTSLLPHTGFIYHCDVVQSLPPVSKYMYININNIQFISVFMLANSWSAFLSIGP